MGPWSRAPQLVRLCRLWRDGRGDGHLRSGRGGHERGGGGKGAAKARQGGSPRPGGADDLPIREMVWLHERPSDERHPRRLHTGVCTSGGGLESRDEGGREALSAARIGGMRSGRVDRPCNRPPARLCPKMPSYHRRARFDPFFDGPPPAFYTENNIVRPEQALRTSKPKGGYGDQNQRWSPKGMFPAMLTYQYTNEVAHV